MRSGTAHTHLTALWPCAAAARKRLWHGLVASRHEGIHRQLIEAGSIETIVTLMLSDATLLSLGHHAAPPEFEVYNNTHPLRREAAG